MINMSACPAHYEGNHGEDSMAIIDKDLSKKRLNKRKNCRLIYLRYCTSQKPTGEILFDSYANPSLDRNTKTKNLSAVRLFETYFVSERYT
jgi:hypothetical protein